ncbi:ABC transporter family substrate-binding protein [Arthrobacter russicus]|jgi:peptide/nickel transport system substrate-binding protein|uniref:Peptide/nickel transport system substrate-binding protein n=1 Tax=Arthrobacter russicus TaxID=172040 RepID=A0ABU1JBZ9_9MICC|nr:ABC transporter family substrate-binding protein [Arthrobacter russicus]MDR6269952.1 peptide/nickel transport system substrate-binding protein [Arthrobacter russicus]
MKTKLTVGGAALVAAALVITGCGGGGGQGQGPASGAAQTAGADISKLVSINAQPRENLKQGGKVTIPLGNIGPDFNTSGQNGNSADGATLMSAMNSAGCWVSQADGTPKLVTDFCSEFKSATENGKQTIKIKINDKAIWNDGTPIAADAFINTWKMLNGENPEVNIVTPGAYENIESVVQGATPKDVTVTMKQPTYPLDNIFGTILNPKVNTPDVFNNGFVQNMRPDWAAGPFKLENYDSAAKTVSMVPNDKWWGQKPVLDQLVFRQMESAATIAAFKNQEIDVTTGNTLNRYNQLKDSPNTDIRRGQRLFAGGMNINAQAAPMTDVAVRDAVFTAVDRKALATVRYNGLNWEETTPGSMMLLPFSKYYQDNYPAKTTGPDAAKKVLTDAGYTAGSDGIMTKDGQKLAFKITNFGDDPTTLALVQTLQKQLRDGGMDLTIDQKGSSEFGKVVGERSFQLTISGYTVGADATTAVKQYYDSKTSNNKVGDAALDERIAKVSTIEDDAARNKEAMDIEKEHMAKYFSMGVAFNGPDIYFARTGLANYGANLFQSLSSTNWVDVGWQK